jgi:hypothetical protein
MRNSSSPSGTCDFMLAPEQHASASPLGISRYRAVVGPDSFTRPLPPSRRSGRCPSG